MLQQNKQKGFTLIEILLSLGILALGLSGILTLFPVGLDAGQKAIQDITSTLIAESLMDVLRASILQKHPDGNLPFIFDGINTQSTIPNASYSSGTYSFKNNGNNAKLSIKSCGTVPDGEHKYTKTNYQNSYNGTLTAYNEDTDEHSLQQYGYDVYIVENTDQTHLYDVTIVIKRNNNPIRRFYSQIMIPKN